jgi:DNA-binding LacI/PurR family transcriptional regulator
MLLQRMQGSEAKPRDVRIGYELIIRESSTLRRGRHVR